MIRILGVDPGSAATGWALVAGRGRRLELEDAGVLRSGKGDRAVRLARLSEQFGLVVERLRPDEAAVESSFSGRNPRSSLSLAESRGVLLAVLGRCVVPTASYTPAQVKTAVVGYGRATKEQVRAMAQVAYMVRRLLQLDETLPADAADAAAVALAHLQLAGRRRAERA